MFRIHVYETRFKSDAEAFAHYQRTRLNLTQTNIPSVNELLVK